MLPRAKPHVVGGVDAARGKGAASRGPGPAAAGRTMLWIWWFPAPPRALRAEGMVGSRLASIDGSVPGGPINSRLYYPMAAISKRALHRFLAFGRRQNQPVFDGLIEDFR